MPRWLWNTACCGLTCTAFSSAVADSLSLPAWRYSRPRLACTPPSSGFDCASAFSCAVDSSLRPARIARRAVSNAACARGSTGTSGSAGWGGITTGDGAVLSAAAARSAGVGLAACAACASSAGVLSVDGAVICLTIATGSGIEAQPHNAATIATGSASANGCLSVSTNRIDHAFTALQFSVAHRLQRGQRLEALLHYLVVDA